MTTILKRDRNARGQFIRPRPFCRHCGEARANRPRGLCWSCYYRAGVRNQYPSGSKYARRGLHAGHLTAPLPDSPTDARPGSEEKIRILEERARRGECLFHPDDSQLSEWQQTYERVLHVFRPRGRLRWAA